MPLFQYARARSLVLAPAIIQLLQPKTKNDWMRVRDWWKRKEGKKIYRYCYSLFSTTDGKRWRKKRNLTSHLISCGFHRCVWFEQCAGTWRVKNALPFYEPFEVVPSEVLRTLAGRSLFMAIRCTRQGWKTYIKKIKKNSSDSPSYRRLSRTLTPFTRDCQRFIGNFNIIVKKKLRVQKNDSNENKMIFFAPFDHWSIIEWRKRYTWW